MEERLRAYGAEFLGTAWMVAIGTGSVAMNASHLVVCLSFGIAVTVAILVLRSVSGAHINPAVSTAFVVSGHLPRDRWFGYVLAQLLGGLLGSLAVLMMFSANHVAPTVLASHVSLVEGAGIEVLITALLMASIYIIVALKDGSTLAVALWVGATVAALAWVAGPLTGASMNPARTLGPNLLSGEGMVLYYAVTTVLGAWLAALGRTRLRPT
jgi:glycerol uptake facilitator-like aquaporin